MNNRTQRRVPRVLAAAVSASALAVALAACGSSGSDTAGSNSGSDLVIGVSAAQTGYLSATDLGYIAGIKLAVAAINKSGGAGGHKMTIASVLDEQSNPSAGVSNVNKLINASKVNAVLAGADSTACSSAQSVVTRAEVPMLCVAPPPSGSAYQFEVSSSVKQMIDTIMASIHAQGIKSVAYLGTTSVYGHLIGNFVKADAQADGMTVAATTTVASDAKDLTATMQKLGASHPGAVVDSLAGPAHILEAKGAAAAGLNVPLVMMSDSLKTFQQATDAYPATQFVVQAPQAYPALKSAALKAANKSFVSAFDASGDDSSLLASAAYGWDAVHVLAAAVKQSGEVTGSGVQKALETMKYQGAVTLFQFSASDHTGASSGLNPYQVGSFKNGKLAITYEG